MGGQYRRLFTVLRAGRQVLDDGESLYGYRRHDAWLECQRHHAERPLRGRGKGPCHPPRSNGRLPCRRAGSSEGRLDGFPLRDPGGRRYGFPRRLRRRGTVEDKPLRGRKPRRQHDRVFACARIWLRQPNAVRRTPQRQHVRRGGERRADRRPSHSRRRPLARADRVDLRRVRHIPQRLHFRPAVRLADGRKGRVFDDMDAGCRTGRPGLCRDCVWNGRGAFFAGDQ